MLSLSNSNILFASGLGLSSLCSCQQGIKRGISEPAVRLWSFMECYEWGKSKWAVPLCLIPLSWKPKTSGWLVKCKWCKAQVRLHLLTTYQASAEQNVWVSAFVNMSFPGLLKAKCALRCKGQESSSREVMDMNPNSHFRCFLWKQTLTQKWQKQKINENRVFCPRMSYLLGEGGQEQWLCRVPPAFHIQFNPASDDRNFLHFD